MKKLAESITTEHGKTMFESIGEIKRGLEVSFYICHNWNLRPPHIVNSDCSFIGQEIKIGHIKAISKSEKSGFFVAQLEKSRKTESPIELKSQKASNTKAMIQIQ